MTRPVKPGQKVRLFMTNIDLTPIFQALIVLAAALITRYVVPWIKAKTTLDQRREIRDLVSILVFAAEKLYTGSGRGEEKLAWVQERLNAHGYKLDTNELAELVNAEIAKLESSTPLLIENAVPVAELTTAQEG